MKNEKIIRFIYIIIIRINIEFWPYNIYNIKKGENSVLILYIIKKYLVYI